VIIPGRKENGQVLRSAALNEAAEAEDLPETNNSGELRVEWRIEKSRSNDRAFF
jgi:hypothetical protein